MNNNHIKDIKHFSITRALIVIVWYFSAPKVNAMCFLFVHYNLPMYDHLQVVFLQKLNAVDQSEYPRGPEFLFSSSQFRVSCFCGGRISSVCSGALCLLLRRKCGELFRLPGTRRSSSSYQIEKRINISGTSLDLWMLAQHGISSKFPSVTAFRTKCNWEELKFKPRTN